MTFLDWLAGSGSTLVVATASLIAACAAYVQGRANSLSVRKSKDTLDSVHDMVNGNTTAREARVAQLENYIRISGIPVPPTPLPPSVPLPRPAPIETGTES